MFYKVAVDKCQRQMIRQAAGIQLRQEKSIATAR